MHEEYLKWELYCKMLVGDGRILYPVLILFFYFILSALLLLCCTCLEKKCIFQSTNAIEDMFLVPLHFSFRTSEYQYASYLWRSECIISLKLTQGAQFHLKYCVEPLTVHFPTVLSVWTCFLQPVEQKHVFFRGLNTCGL